MIDYTKLPIGTGVYYTGDMANDPGAGTIVDHVPATQYLPLAYVIQLEDGRLKKHINAHLFDSPQGKGGHRFEVMEERDAARAQAMAQIRAQLQASKVTE